jgi:iron complex transport system ATP-binding protein
MPRLNSGPAALARTKPPFRRSSQIPVTSCLFPRYLLLATCYFSPVHEPFLEIRNATVWRGDTPALKNFSLTLRHGESVAILGPNGAGKSTLLKVLTGEVRPEANPDTICRLFGEDLWSLEELRHRIGVVMPEDVARFHPEEVAHDVVLSSLRGAFGRTRDMRFSRAEKAAADQAIERLGIGALAQRDFGTLSSGERRRFLIARAIVHDPSVLVLDEPSTALDFAASLSLVSALRELAVAGHTLVLVTHHPGEIPPEIDRAILLERGTVLADGPKRKVLSPRTLGGLFGLPLAVSWSGGWCTVKPA